MKDNPSACTRSFTQELVLHIGNQLLVLLASMLFCSDVSTGVAGNKMSYWSVVCANKP